jgi:hypothetical protein
MTTHNLTRTFQHQEIIRDAIVLQFNFTANQNAFLIFLSIEANRPKKEKSQFKYV